jgi:hypothetical protein
MRFMFPRNFTCKALGKMVSAALLMLLATGAHAANYYVNANTGVDTNPGTAAAPWQHIQKAINSAATGGTIYVAAGAYRESLSWSKNLTIQGAGEGLSIVDPSAANGGPAGRCLLTSNLTPASRIAGFTFQNGRSFFGDIDNSGGAGIFNIGSSLTIAHCTFTNNVSSSLNGGGMTNYISQPTVTDCTFIHNRANAASGMFNERSSPNVTNCLFSDEPSGAMINTGSKATITHCIFTNNSTNSDGAGIYSLTNSDTTVIDCTFTGNVARRGGAMFSNGNSTTVTNCTFSGNYARALGGGMYDTNGNSVVTNCTFSGNSADGSGGGSYFANSTSILTNCILWGNTAPMDAGISLNTSSLVITSSDIQGLSNTTPDADGNFAADPLFVNALNGDLHFAFGSPAIDTGNDGALPPGITTDLDGNLRIGRAHVDLGAYEYQNLAPTASAQSLSLTQDTTANIALSGSDPEGDALLTYTVSTPAHGNLTGTGANVTYHPAAGYFGTDSFTVTVTDAYGTVSSPATVSITVNAIPTPVEVTGQVRIQASGFTAAGGANYTQTLTLTNTSGSDITGPIYLLIDNLGGAGVQLTNLSGTTVHLTPAGRPYISLSNTITSQSSLKILLKFSNPNRVSITDTPRLFAGQGSM